jgi:hypothetical protein
MVFRLCLAIQTYHEPIPPQPYIYATTPFWASVSGTVIVALCCFTPVLVITLSAIGLGAVVGYLDYVLLPAGVQGVQDAIVTFNPPEAVIVYDPAQASIQDLIQATTNAGYPSLVKSTN